MEWEQLTPMAKQKLKNYMEAMVWETSKLWRTQKHTGWSRCLNTRKRKEDHRRMLELTMKAGRYGSRIVAKGAMNSTSIMSSGRRWKGMPSNNSQHNKIPTIIITSVGRTRTSTKIKAMTTSVTTTTQRNKRSLRTSSDLVRLKWLGKREVFRARIWKICLTMNYRRDRRMFTSSSLNRTPPTPFLGLVRTNLRKKWKTVSNLTLVSPSKVTLKLASLASSTLDSSLLSRYQSKKVTHLVGSIRCLNSKVRLKINQAFSHQTT